MRPLMAHRFEFSKRKSEAPGAPIIEGSATCAAYSRLYKWPLGRVSHFLAQCRPFQQGVERRAQCLSPLRQAILDLGWNLMMDDSSDDPIGFHLAKLLDEHFLRNRGNRPFQVREAKHFAAE